MKQTKFKALKASISRGGFSDERVFEIKFGGKNCSGVASRVHMWNSDGSPLSDEEPPIGQTIHGLVAAHVLQVNGAQIIVSVPDGQVISVVADELQERPQEGDYVSVRS